MPYNEKECESAHKSIESRFISGSWVMGMIITLQLATFGWLGYLSSKVVTLDMDFHVSKATVDEKLCTIAQRQEKLMLKIDGLDLKIDSIITRNAGIDGPAAKRQP